MLRTLLKIAPPYDDVMLEKVKAAFAGYSAEGLNFEIEEDPSVIGGFIAYIGDTIFDASVRKQLNDIRGLIRKD